MSSQIQDSWKIFRTTTSDTGTGTGTGMETEAGLTREKILRPPLDTLKTEARGANLVVLSYANLEKKVISKG